MAQITKKESDIWFVLKAFAILSVITAHMPFGENYFAFENIRNSLGQIGVGIFFISSGYFYSRKTNDTVIFWKKKLQTVIVPWLFFSIVTFVLGIFLTRKTSVDVFSFIQQFLGIGSSYWYMSMLIILFAVFKLLKSDFSLYLCVILSIISVFLSAMGLIQNIWLFNDKVCINQYLNIFNWVGFFAFGMILRKKNLLEKLIGLKPIIYSLLGITGALFFAIIRKQLIISYIDYTSLFVEFFGFILLLNVSNWLHNKRTLISVGKKSFFIYLMHIQIAGALNTRLPYTLPFFILRPIITLAICYVIAVVFKYLLSKIKLSKYNYLFGLDR